MKRKLAKMEVLKQARRRQTELQWQREQKNQQMLLNQQRTHPTASGDDAECTGFIIPKCQACRGRRLGDGEWWLSRLDGQWRGDCQCCLTQA